MYMAIGPFAGRCVRTEDQHAGSSSCDDDEWDDEGNAPGDVGCEALSLHKRIKDSGHKEVGDASTWIAEAASESVGCADNVFIEETR